MKKKNLIQNQKDDLSPNKSNESLIKIFIKILLNIFLIILEILLFF